MNEPETYHYLSFNYNDEIFNYNLSDSFNGGESNYEGQSDCFPIVVVITLTFLINHYKELYIIQI